MACLVWFLFRWLGSDMSIEFFRNAISTLRFEYFISGGALPGAVLGIILHHRRGAPTQNVPALP